MRLAQSLKPVHLRLIVKIADTGKLGLAADAIGMAQPGASRILAEVEADAGGPLFHRETRGMVPTDLGQAFLRHARQILMQFEGLQDDLRAISDGRSGAVSIGGVTGPMLGSVIPAVEALKRRDPDVTVSLQIAPSAQLVRGLEEGAFDFILARLPAGHPDRDLDLIPWGDEDIVLVVHDSHPLAGSTAVTLGDLTGLEWIMQEPGTPIRAAVVAAFRAAGVTPPRNVTNAASLLATVALLGSGRAISAQPREVATLLADGRVGGRFTTLPVAAEITVPVCHVITRRTTRLGAAASRFLADLVAGKAGRQPGVIRP